MKKVSLICWIVCVFSLIALSIMEFFKGNAISGMGWLCAGCFALSSILLSHTLETLSTHNDSLFKDYLDVSDKYMKLLIESIKGCEGKNN